MQRPFFPPSSSSRPPPRKEGTYRVRRLNDDVTETSYDGHLTAELIAACDVDYWRMAGERALPYAILDGTAITGYDPAISGSAGPAMRLFRERGGIEMLVVTANGSIRMIASALAASTRVPCRFFETRADAFEHLKSIGRW